MRFYLRLLPALLALALPLSTTNAQTQNLPDLGESAQADFSPQAERRMGESIMSNIRRDPAYVEDPQIVEFVNKVGQRLVAASPEAAGMHFEFFVVRDPTINAFALPGGYIGVQTGLLAAAQTESEFASVLAHEIAHVTQHHIARQLQSQNQLSTVSIVGMVLALLAARSNSQIAQAAIVTGSAVPAASFLNYSRDFEREADRVGFQTLLNSGYDPHGMPAFFERMERDTRLYENNAPGYLRTHPLTSERIADMQNRAQDAPLKQRPDAPDFQLVRADLRAQRGTPEEARNYFHDALSEGRYHDEGSARYGYATALLRAHKAKDADSQLAQARKLIGPHPMFDALAARIKVEQGNRDGALAILAQSAKTYPDDIAVRLDYAKGLQEAGRNAETLKVLGQLDSDHAKDPRVYELKAHAYSGLGKRVEQHRALAEAYYLQGSLPGAVQQLRLAQSAQDADFYTMSAVDARLRELEAEQRQELKDKRR